MNAALVATEKMQTEEEAAAALLQQAKVEEKVHKKAEETAKLLKVHVTNSKRKVHAAEETTARSLMMKELQVKGEVVLAEADEAEVRVTEAAEARVGEIHHPGGPKKDPAAGGEEPLHQENKMHQFANSTTKENAQKAKIATIGMLRYVNTSKEVIANTETIVSTGIPR